MWRSKLLLLATAAATVFCFYGINAAPQSSTGSILNSIMNTYENMMRRTSRLLNRIYYDDYRETADDEYDFVIVGSGSAGSVLANRLSEMSAWKILLLEVGEEASFLTDIPVIASIFQFTNYNWGYTMEKQANMSLGFDEQRMNWPRGRALGGTTVINYMIHIRGNKVDYDQWEALGNPGWSWKDVFPYFLKSENALLRTKDSGYHSTDGYLNVQDVPFRTRSADVFVAAAQEVGYKYVDYNGEDQLGVSYVQATLRNGSRCSAEKAFLRPIRHRSNLKILIKARVTKILIDPATKRAYGVEYLKNRRYHKAVARKEVILSAGAFNSPQLLMLSGIGPKKHLEDLGIKVLKDLPVGQKLYDHLTFVGLTFKINETIVSRQSDLENPASFVQLALHGNGPMTTLGGVEGLAYIRTNVSTHPSANYPDMELIFVSGHFNTDRGTIYRKIFRLTDNLYETIWKPLENSNTFTMFPMLVHPKSYGHLELKSKNPFHWPKFYGNYLQHPDDIRTFIQGIRIAQRIALSDAFKKYDVEQVTTPLPGCKHLTFDSDPYWECALRYLSSTLHHQVATCKMGPAHDPEAVVDNQLRVYGINNLRVVDTSIIPIPLTAHTNVPAFMVGEKAADLIKAEWSEEHLQPRF